MYNRLLLGLGLTCGLVLNISAAQKFKESPIRAVIVREISESSPLRLKASPLHDDRSSLDIEHATKSVNADTDTPIPVPEIRQPNRCMQCISAFFTCFPALFGFICCEEDDRRECCLLHRKYVEPFDLNSSYEENQCCLCLNLFFPCVTPQTYVGSNERVDSAESGE